MSGQPRQEMSVQAIAAEWDTVAGLRYQQIESGQDITYRHVLFPAVMELAESLHGKRVLDVGCGLGFIARELAETAATVVAVDPSRMSIRIAEDQSKKENLSFEAVAVEDYALRISGGGFDLAVSNMVLQCVPDIERNVASIVHVLKPGGVAVFTIPHPCFWPLYVGLPETYKYSREASFRWRYRISTDDRVGPEVTHFYRPLSRYLDVLVSTGFSLDRMIEPMPSSDVLARYPSPWRFPRYLALRVRKR